MKIKKFAVAGTIAGLVMASIGASAASASVVDDDALDSSEHAVLLDQGLIEPTGGSLHLQNEPGTVSTQATAPLTDGRHRISAQSTGNSVRNTFSSLINIANAYTFAKVEEGTTISTFTGAGSGNVESVTKFWATGLAVSVSAPPAASFSIASGEASYTGRASGVNTTTTRYSGLEFAGPLFTVNQNVTSTWYVNNNTYAHTTN